jgi:hypothetical protein
MNEIWLMPASLHTPDTKTPALPSWVAELWLILAEYEGETE